MTSFAIDRYEVHGQELAFFKELGIYHGRTRANGQDVIIKPIKNLAQNPKVQQHALQMGKIIKELSHPVLIPLVDQSVASVDVHNISGPIESISLSKPATAVAADRSLTRSDHLGVLESSEITAIALQVIGFLRYLHNKPLASSPGDVGMSMRDLRPESLWLSGSGANIQVHIFDLGAAMMTEDMYLESLDYRTLPYVSPEVLHKKRGFLEDYETVSLTTACDMWSFALTLLDLATGYKARSVRRGSATNPVAGPTHRNNSLHLASGTQTPNSLLTRSHSGSSLGSSTIPNNQPTILNAEWTFEEHIWSKMNEHQRMLFQDLSLWVQAMIKACLVEDPLLRVSALAETTSDLYDRELLRHENAIQAMRVQEKVRK